MFDFDRLNEILSERGISKSKLCRLVNKSTSYIVDSKNKSIEIPDSVVIAWADFLGVSPAYLLGETDKKEKPTTVSGSGHTKQAVDFAQENADLTSEEWLKLKEYALFLKAQRSTEDLK